MISNRDIKFIKSLHLKKNRDAEKLFIAEGEKLVKDLINQDLSCKYLLTTDEQLKIQLGDRANLIDEVQMKKVTTLKSPSPLLGVFEQIQFSESIHDGLVLMLDDVRDPGNFGTIIRTADWFGVSQIICSKNSVELYNPKVVAATMGCLANVQVIYKDLSEVIQKDARPVIAAMMEGDSLKDFSWPKDCFLLMGNEANGVSNELMSSVTQSVHIPGSRHKSSESLNLSVATSVLISSYFLKE